MQDLINEFPHRRYNPLTGEWVLVSPHRTKRPWQGKQEKNTTDRRPQYDKNCYLCPTNQRAGAHQNPDYQETFVFDNDFAALLPDNELQDDLTSPFFKTKAIKGTCRVICFSPRHDLTMAEMPVDHIRKVIDLWAEQLAHLGKNYQWVQIFENKGTIMGCSNPHPHGQIWAGDDLPVEAEKEDRHQKAYYTKYNSPLLIDYLDEELKSKKRIVIENKTWLALVPYWAIWPYEILLLPKNHVKKLNDLTDTRREGLADILKRLTTKYDNLFETSFPYTMGWHNAPFNNSLNDHWQLHAHFYPPLLRSATVKKFMVGYEMLAGPQRDITAEQAAEKLRALPEKHFRE